MRRDGTLEGRSPSRRLILVGSVIMDQICLYVHTDTHLQDYRDVCTIAAGAEGSPFAQRFGNVDRWTWILESFKFNSVDYVKFSGIQIFPLIFTLSAFLYFKGIVHPDSFVMVYSNTFFFSGSKQFFRISLIASPIYMHCWNILQSLSFCVS